MNDQLRVVHQPFVHDLFGVFAAPLQAWFTKSGDMRALGVEGVFLADDRLIKSYRVNIQGGPITSTQPDGLGNQTLPPGELSHVGTQTHGATTVRLIDAVCLTSFPVDPLVRMTRTRTATIYGLHEQVALQSAADQPLALNVSIRLAIDALPMSAVKDPRLVHSLSTPAPTATLHKNTATWSWRKGTHAELTVSGTTTNTSPPTLRYLKDEENTLVAELNTILQPGTATEFSWSLEAHDAASPFQGVDEPELGTTLLLPAATNEEQAHVGTLLHQSLADLSSLRLARTGDKKQAFLAAGAPWFFTLFGRDSLIAASFLAPLNRDLAMRTVRTLATQQGKKTDAQNAEQPGKILHEVRAVGMDMGDIFLPPVYYGTIDATSLWLQLISDLTAAGEELADLAGNVASAASWLLDYADADGDFFLEYIDESGHGLINQGWKDSGDSIRFADGTIAHGPIALSEVQAYAYEAALVAADLLESWQHRPAAELVPRLRERAHHIKQAFREQFWVEDEKGPYIALALDGTKQPVTAVASNMGHILGTGLLNPQEERLVIARLMDPTMFSGFGIRTLDTTNGAYWPSRYHGGSVWTHDTAFIMRQAARAGFTEEATMLARALLRAAQGFDWRLPELFSGDSSEDAQRPLPYPASCRPQAWAAASAVPIAQILGVLPG